MSPPDQPLQRIAPDVKLGKNVRIFSFTNLYGCEIGDDVKIGTFVEIQKGSKIGNRCKISSHTFICEGVTLEDEVFVGHNVVFTNDRYPRSTNGTGRLQSEADWVCIPTLVKHGASIGSGAVLLCGITVGEKAMIGAGSVVTKDVPAGATVAGNPARLVKPPRAEKLTGGGEKPFVATENFAPGSVRRVSPLEISNWDEQLTRRPDFSFFHGAAWLRVLAETYGFAPYYFATGVGNVSESLLPLMEVDSWLTGRRGVALPFTDECAPLTTDQAENNKLFQSAIELGRERGWKYIECRGGRRLFGDVPAALSYCGHHLKLTADVDKLFGGLESSVRRAIRKSQNEGVTVEVSQDLAAVRIFYRLQCETRKRHGLPPQPFAFFVNIHRHILSQNQGIIAVANHAGQAVAASVYFFLGGRAIYKYGASDLTRQQLRANNSVMWEAIRWLASQGATQLHFGKTAPANAGLRRFKLAWGTTEETIEYVKYDLRQHQFVTDTDAVSGWHNTVFRSLPGVLSRAAGKLLYKHWA